MPMSYANPKVGEVDSPVHFFKITRSDQGWVRFALGGAILVALVSGSGFRLLRHSSIPGQSYRGGSEQATTVPEFAHPFHTAAPTLRLASPGLLPSTPSRARLQTVMAGRNDPFASVLTPGQVGAVPGVMVTPMAAPLVVSPLPQPRGIATVPATLGSAPLTLPAPPAMGIDRSNTALNSHPPSVLDQISVTGVVQIGDQISVIITDSTSPRGRRVTVGETLAAGQVRLQRVDLSNGEPLVVLRHQGSDYYRTIGQGATTL